MNREQVIKNLVSQFEEQINNLSAKKLEGLESGKYEISITPVVGHEAGGASAAAAVKNRANTSLGAATASTASAARRTTDIRRP